MSSTLLLVSGRYFLKVTADLTNTGASKIPFTLKTSGLRIFQAGPPPTRRAEIVGWERILYGEDVRSAQVDRSIRVDNSKLVDRTLTSSL